MKPAWKNVPAWEDVTVPSAALPWPSRLAAVIEDLDVESAPRYAPSVVNGKPKTFCNIYVTDVVRNVGLRAPRHWMTKSGDPATIGQGIEHSANAMCNWLAEHGGRYGWYAVDEEAARDAAERGHIVIAGWKNPLGVGHVAIVLGEEDGETVISQAGKSNFERGPLSRGFGKQSPSFWVQAERVGDETSHHS